MPLLGFETAVSAGKWPQTYAFDRAATGKWKYIVVKNNHINGSLNI